jgi:rhodanese-related sulfurtransferase
MSTDIPQPGSVTVEELAAWMQALLPKLGSKENDTSSGEKGQVTPYTKIIILDVRDPEEILSTGYIRSSKSVTHVSFEDDDDADEQVKSLLAMAEGTINPAFVFHCAYSQQRGPFAASRFLSRCSVQDKQPTVLILQGGFDSWKRLSLENELVSNFTMPPQ